MTEPVLGSYYTFKFVGGRVYTPENVSGEGMFVGKRGNYNVFATALPKRSADTSVIQSVCLTYTTLAFHAIQFPSDKVMITTETLYCLQTHLRSDRFKDPHENGRTFPTVVLTPDVLLA